MSAHLRPVARFVAALASVLLAAGCTSAHPVATEDPGVATVKQSAPPVSGDGPPVPAHGAYVGAYVQPSLYTQPGYEDAVRSFERRAGRRLDIVHTFHPWGSDFPTSSDVDFTHDGAYLLLSWAGTDTRAIVNGNYDELIAQRARGIAQLGVPVFLEWRWEMDRPNLASQVWSGQDYVAAWLHIRRIFANQGVPNVSWVWCPTSNAFATGDAEQYYPGDDQVDWVCTDAYPGSTSTSLADLLRPAVALADAHHKPLMVGEFGKRDDGSQAGWLAAGFDWAAGQPAIKALVYFDANFTDKSGFTSPLAVDTPRSWSVVQQALAQGHFNPRGLRTSK
jgi:hypothetical protein